MKQLSRVSLCALVLAITWHMSTAYGQTITKLGEVPQFVKPVRYPVPGATGAVLADVNGDGILDIVTANGFPGDSVVAGGQGVSVLLGNGDGSFQAARTVLATGNPTSVVVGDFNGDGKQDIVVAYGSGVATLSILYGNGDGTFKAPATIPIGYFANVTAANNLGVSSLVAGDFNGDGKLDLALASSSIIPNPLPGTGGSPFVDDFALEILVNRGNGTFAPTDSPVPGVSSGVPFPLIVADFDGDGKPDLVSSDGTLLLSNGDGTFRSVPTSAGTVHVCCAIGDFNGDGRLDMAGLGSGSGRGHIFPPPPSIMSFGLPGGNFTAPFTSNFITSIVTITNNGLTTSVTFNGLFPDNLVAADFNGDGKLDIAGFRDISYGTGDGQFNPTFNTVDFDSALQFTDGILLPSLVEVGDLDGDGAPDLIAMGDGNSVQVALNTAGRAPKLAQLGLLDNPTSATSSQTAKSVVGGSATVVTGEVSLGAPAPAGGALVTLVSSNAAVFFPSGNTVLIPAGSQFADFKVSTRAVSVPTLTMISATYHLVTLNTSLSVVSAFTLASIAPVTVLGEFGGHAGVGTLTLSGPASDGVVVSLASANPAVLRVPASVAVAPGATTATFPMTANHVAADTVVTVTGTLAGTTRSGAVTVKAQPAIVVIQKAEYVVKKGQLNVQATSTNIAGGAAIPSLTVYNASTGALIGSIRLANVGNGNVGQFNGILTATGSLTSIGVQDFAGGLAIGAVAQK